MKDKEIILVIVVVLAVLLIGGFGFGMMNFGGWGGMMGGYGGMMGGYYGFGWVIQILFVIILILGIIWFVRQLGEGKRGNKR